MDLNTSALAFAALGQPTRLGMLRLLIATGPSGLSVTDIGRRLGLAQSTTSFHLGVLEGAGLAQATRRGRSVIYAARFLALRELLTFLTDACCEGRPELCADLSAVLSQLAVETPTMSPAFNVLFLCTRNSARSIMAEAITNAVAGDRFHAYSAGSDPGGTPMPEVLDRLTNLGHDVSGLHSKSWELFLGPDAPRMDFVIALCDALAGQSCPDFGGTAVTAAWPLPDPAKFTGSAAEKAALLNELYTSLRRRIEIFAALPFASLDRMAVRKRLDELGAGPAGVMSRTGAG